MWATCSCCWRLECTSPRGFVLRDGTERTFFKSSADRGGHCTSNVATLPSTSSISLLLLGRAALFSSFAFLLGLLFPPPPHNHTSFPPSRFLLTSILGIDKWDAGQTRAFSSGCIWHGDSPASAKARQFNSIISLSNMPPPPAPLLEMRCFYIAGEDRMTGDEPARIIHLF